MVLGTGVFSIAGLSTLWLGMLIALAIEARVKFKAESLTREVGLDVGRHVFGVFGRIELVTLALLVILTLVLPTHLTTWIAVGLVAVVVALQAAWLRPALNERVAQIIRGDSVPKSNSHKSYMVTELLKISTLALLTFAI